MNLGKNVYNLLKRQSEVYVRGLGSFRRNHTPATYDEKRHVYLPPISYIDFDRSSTVGYEFVQYIQQLHLLERQEAESQVAEAVDALLQKVSDEGQAKLDDLGYLVSYGNSYVFKALDLSGFNYEPVEAPGDLFGATSGMPDEDNLVPDEPSSSDTMPEEERKVVQEQGDLPEEQPIAAEIIDPQTEEVPEKGKGNAVWYVVTAIVALGVMAALYLVNRDRTLPKTADTAALAKDTLHSRTDTLENTLPSDTSARQDSLAQQVVDSSSVTVNDKKELIPAHHTWQIVIGSHKTLAQAYEQAESYNKAGYPHVRVIPSNLAKNRKKVIWDSYETKEQVDSALIYVQKHIIKDAWPDKIR